MITIKKVLAAIAGFLVFVFVGIVTPKAIILIAVVATSGAVANSVDNAEMLKDIASIVGLLLAVFLYWKSYQYFSKQRVPLEK